MSTLRFGMVSSILLLIKVFIISVVSFFWFSLFQFGMFNPVFVEIVIISLALCTKFTLSLEASLFSIHRSEFRVMGSRRSKIFSSRPLNINRFVSRGIVVNCDALAAAFICLYDYGSPSTAFTQTASLPRSISYIVKSWCSSTIFYR